MSGQPDHDPPRCICIILFFASQTKGFSDCYAICITVVHYIKCISQLGLGLRAHPVHLGVRTPFTLPVMLISASLLKHFSAQCIVMDF